MAKTKDKLKEYARKRSPDKTPEPFKSGGRSKGGRVFVIQKHDASSLHYDFRLEIDGVLKSWAVPKGPSVNPSDKRLAIETEDHPLAYKSFEGVIPEEEYGGGTVMVWDAGTYKNVKRKDGRQVGMKQCYNDGVIEVELHGEKLKGGFALRKFRPKQNQWLLIKMDDHHADRRRKPTNTENKSVLSGRSMKQIEKEESPDDNSG